MGSGAIRSATLCLYFFIFATVIAHVQGSSKNATNTTLDVQNRIINGIATEKGRYPYVVQLYETRGRGDFLCGGVLIGTLFLSALIGLENFLNTCTTSNALSSPQPKTWF